MQKVKHIALSALLTLCVFSSVLYTSCKDKCGSTSCSNGGTCVDGVCECPTGYYGNGCQNSWSSVFIGTYNCTKTCNPSISGCTAPWQSSITVDATNGGNTVDISDFGGCTTLIAVATVDTAVDSVATINIVPSTVSEVSAHGSLRIFPDSTIITVTYTVASGGGSGGYTCSMRMVKQ